MRSHVVIYATIAIDIALFGANLYVAQVSSSRAVLSQSVYSLADLIGASFLLWGFVASQRPPTQQHPFGFGKERFFWAFLAAFVTFTVSGVLVLVLGVERVLSPQPVGDLPSALVVVGLSIIASLAGIWVAVRELRRAEQTVSALLDSAHMGLKTIFIQDVVAIVASVVAFSGIALVAAYGTDLPDGISACIVGVMLIVTGALLTTESRSFLIGRSIPPKVARAILGAVERDPRVRRVRGLQSMMLGPDDALLALRVNFVDGLTTDEVEFTIDGLSAVLRGEYPQIRHLIIEPEA